MKSNLIVLALVCLLSFTLGANATNLSTDDFQITPLDNPSVELNATKAWTLKYNNKQDLGFVIELIPTKKGMEYVVYSDYFEVSYACCKNGFGVKKVKSAWSKVDSNLTDRVLDSNQLARQQILSPTQVTEAEALGLIASYLPDLMKGEYKYLLN